MTDLDFNRHPVEKLCLKKLKQAGIVPQEDKPFSLQLLVWVLECHRDVLSPATKASAERLFEVASQMFQWDAKTTQSHLLETDPWSKQTLKEMDDWVPEHVGGALADQLHASLQERGTLQ